MMPDINRLRADVAEILRVPADEIEDDDNLVDLGLDSVRLMMLVQRWREAGAAVEFADLAEWPALDRWAVILAARSGEPAGAPEPPPSQDSREAGG